MSPLLDQAKSLPTRPGVYLFHDQADGVIYVGKAINLRSRVSSYFRKSHDLGPAKTIMLDQIRRIEHILVRSETEALLLESTLIKKHRPKYNILLKDDKDFQYIKIALAEQFPTVTTVRRITIDGSRYFGPYTSGLSVRRTMRLLKRLFPYKNCTNPPEIPCFDYHLHRCLGHDTGPGSVEKYHEVVIRLIHFLEGHTGDVLKSLRRNMDEAAKSRDFEQAAIFRDRLQALSHVLEQQTVISARGGAFDLVSLAREEDLAAINLFQVRAGKLVQRDQFMLQHTHDQDDGQILAAFIEQYYSQSTNHPPTIYTRVDVSRSVGRPLALNIKTARRGLKRKLVDMGRDNAIDFLQRQRARWMSEDARAKHGLGELVAALKLPAVPKRMEMYDISNFQGDHAVGSMVVFVDGRPSPTHYRKFRIKTIRGSDDVHMMAEVLRRRFSHSGDDAWPKPDLILLDGGKPQLSVVTKSVANLPAVPIAALAKQEEELWLPGRLTPVKLPPDSPGLLLVQRIRDEAHRFAITYYRQRHGRATTNSRLDDVPGLGPTLKKKLLRQFGTLSGIRQANDEAIAQVIGAVLTERLRDTLG